MAEIRPRAGVSQAPAWTGQVTEGASPPRGGRPGFPPHWNVAPAPGTKFTLKGHPDQNVLCRTILPPAPSPCVGSRAASSRKAQPCQFRSKATRMKPAHSDRHHASHVKGGKAGASDTGQRRDLGSEAGVDSAQRRVTGKRLDATSSRGRTRQSRPSSPLRSRLLSPL